MSISNDRLNTLAAAAVAQRSPPSCLASDSELKEDTAALDSLFALSSIAYRQHENSVGRLYDGTALAGYELLFDPLLSTASESACTQLLMSAWAHEGPGVEVAKIVAACLGIFSDPQLRTTSPAMVLDAQDQLSRTLLEHPVLMHPRILVAVRTKRGTVVAGLYPALLMVGAQVPCRSHFEGEPAEDVCKRLHAFAAHPCAQLAMRAENFTWMRALLSPALLTQDGVESAKIVGAAGISMGARPQASGFLASIMDLGEVVHLLEPNVDFAPLSAPLLSLGEHSKAAADATPNTASAEYMTAKLTTLRVADLITYSIIGDVKIGADAVTASTDAELIRGVRLRGDRLRANPEFRKSLISAIFHLFQDGSVSDDLVASAAKVQAQCRRLVPALVDCGLALSPKDAGALILHSVVGIAGSLSKFYWTESIAQFPLAPLLVTLADVGALSGVQQLRDLKKSLGGCLSSYRMSPEADACVLKWIQTLDVHATLTSMTSAIELRAPGEDSTDHGKQAPRRRLGL